MSELEWLTIFGDNLKELMAEYGHTQKSLAEATGLTEAAISRYINKQRMPTITAVINIAYELNCDFNDLLDFGDRIIN